MKLIHSMIGALGLAFVLPAPADAGLNDPEVIIYRFPGVFDDGRNATSFHCTNFSGATETIRFVTRAANSTLLTNVAVNIAHLATFSTSTQDVAVYADAFPPLNTGPVVQGTTAIAATSINIVCTAMTIDASSIQVIGVALRGIRFSPVPGSLE